MQGEIVILDESGDTKIIWDSDKPEEVENAKETFNRFKKKSYVAFKVVGKEGTKGEQLREFDPSADRIIFSPPITGG